MLEMRHTRLAGWDSVEDSRGGGERLQHGLELGQWHREVEAYPASIE